MKDFIVVDLDGTLCNHDHRIQLARHKRWDDYNKALWGDTVREEVLFAVNAFKRQRPDLKMILLTGRSDDYRDETKEWLEVAGVVYDHLIMRPAGDLESDRKVKPRLLLGLLGGLEEARKRVLLILEDRTSVVDRWRHLGFTCWQVQEGDL